MSYRALSSSMLDVCYDVRFNSNAGGFVGAAAGYTALKQLLLAPNSTKTLTRIFRKLAKADNDSLMANVSAVGYAIVGPFQNETLPLSSPTTFRPSISLPAMTGFPTILAGEGVYGSKGGASGGLGLPATVGIAIAGFALVVTCAALCIFREKFKSWLNLEIIWDKSKVKPDSSSRYGEFSCIYSGDFGVADAGLAERLNSDGPHGPNGIESPSSPLPASVDNFGF
jgi:hypothetical protein